MIKKITLIMTIALCFMITPFQADAAGKLKVHFIDVGDGDSILLTCGQENMLVDFGNNDNTVFKYLKKEKIKSLKYAVCTHPHIDHIGSMHLILKKFKVNKAFMTKYERTSSKCYNKAMAVIKKKKIPLVYPKVGKVYKLGQAKVKILGPLGKTYEDLNCPGLIPP